MANFTTGVKVAQLSLKHRMNKSQRQRIIIFVGHPIVEEAAELEDLGKRLKRNNVAIDIINFANPDNIPKLQGLVNAANNSDNSHFMDVPMGVSMITDVLITSPILQNEDFGGGAGVGGADVGGGAAIQENAFAQYGGIDPNIEPELAEAMRISLEEERHRLKDTVVEEPKKDEPEAAQPANPAPADANMEELEDEELDEEEMLRRALEMSKEPQKEEKA